MALRISAGCDSHDGKQPEKGGATHPDRDGQFRYLNDLADDFVDAGEPVISVDTKKKELIGEFANKAKEWHPAGTPVRVSTHDFVTDLGRAIPYNVYDIAHNEGWVSVGDTADTAEFAVAAIRQWWTQMGAARFPNATRLLITCDGGGSNGSRVRAWKAQLAEFAAETGLHITVCHYPPGTSRRSVLRPVVSLCCAPDAARSLYGAPDVSFGASSDKARP